MSHLTKEAIGRLEICFLKIKYFMTKYRSSFLIEDTKHPNHIVNVVKCVSKRKNLNNDRPHKQNYFKCIQPGIYFLWYINKLYKST